MKRKDDSKIIETYIVRFGSSLNLPNNGRDITYIYLNPIGETIFRIYEQEPSTGRRSWCHSSWKGYTKCEYDDNIKWKYYP